MLQRRHEGGKGAKLRGKSKTGASYAVGSNQLSRVRAAECAIAAFVCGSEVAVTWVTARNLSEQSYRVLPLQKLASLTVLTRALGVLLHLVAAPAPQT